MSPARATKRKGSRRKAAARDAAPRAARATGRREVVPFPGRAIRIGEADAQLVRAIQRRLAALGCGPVAVDGDFGPQTLAAVKLFQARFPDAQGQPLAIDGVIGAITWAALFGPESLPSDAARPAPLVRRALEIARGEIGTREEPPGSNRGPRVDQYLRRVGLDPKAGSFPWCAAFVYWCFDESARALGRTNPLVKTAGVLDHWTRATDAGVAHVSAAKAHQVESLVRPGQIFVIDTGSPGGGGHTGLVEEVALGKLVTIEGNTNEGGAREGIGVFRRTGRRIRDVNLGFLDYGAPGK
jgi:hypothetical protein